MKSTKIILLSVIIVSLTNCGDSTMTEQVSSNKQKSVEEANKPIKPDLTNFSKEDVARYAIATIMQKPSKSMKVRIDNDLYYVSYIRKSDNQKFNCKIKFIGNTIIWATIDGRWRDTIDDERISFEEIDKKLKITQTFSDGSFESKEYKVGE